MEFSIKTLAPDRAKAGCLVLGVYAGGSLSRAAQLADRAAHGALRAALAQGDLSGKPGSTLLLRAVTGLAAQRVLLVGLGERKELSEPAFRDAVRGAANALRELGSKDAAVFLGEIEVGRRPHAWSVRQLVLGMREAFYRFDELKTQKKPPVPALAAATQVEEEVGVALAGHLGAGHGRVVGIDDCSLKRTTPRPAAGARSPLP